MAFYIVVEKMSEDALVATYRFKGDWELTGTFQINKENGEILLIEQMPGDEKGHVFSRAAVKILREWKQGNLPQFVEWAS
jgi:hypothetical protein